jgi:hypothetical protein
MEAQKIGGIEEITESKTSQYLHERGLTCKVSTCQKIGVHLQAFFDYYRERVDGRFPVFSLSRFRAASGHGMDASSEEVQSLWGVLKEGALTAETALMLIFVLGMGLPLKVLPLLRLAEQPGTLIYDFQRPNRQGLNKYAVSLPLDEPWIESYWRDYLKQRSAPAEFSYLFTSRAAIKKRQPVSSDYCRRKLQTLIAEILGYPITVNRLERGSLKAMAGKLGLDAFLGRVQSVPLCKKTKFFIWLSANRARMPLDRMPPNSCPKRAQVNPRRAASVFLREGVGV